MSREAVGDEQNEIPFGDSISSAEHVIENPSLDLPIQANPIFEVCLFPSFLDLLQNPFFLNWVEVFIELLFSFKCAISMIWTFTTNWILLETITSLQL